MFTESFQSLAFGVGHIVLGFSRANRFVIVGPETVKIRLKDSKRIKYCKITDFKQIDSEFSFHMQIKL